MSFKKSLTDIFQIHANSQGPIVVCMSVSYNRGKIRTAVMVYCLHFFISLLFFKLHRQSTPVK